LKRTCKSEQDKCDSCTAKSKYEFSVCKLCNKKFIPDKDAQTEEYCKLCE